MSEAVVLAESLIGLTADARVMAWRNNTGTAFTRTGRLISYGLIGSGDILGCVRRVITQDMVGLEYGQAFAVETKSARGVHQQSQKRFQAAWERAGGLYVLARDPETAINRVLSCTPVSHAEP